MANQVPNTDRIRLRRVGALERLNKSIPQLTDTLAKAAETEKGHFQKKLLRAKEEQKVLQERTDPQWVPAKRTHRVKSKKAEE